MSDPARGCRYLAWLFQKAYLKPKLVCIKSFTDEFVCSSKTNSLREKNAAFYGAASAKTGFAFDIGS
jgi:hypothetical protein